MSFRNQLVDGTTSVVAWFRRNQQAKVNPEGPVKVNLGSGFEVVEGWINVDGGLNSFFSILPRPLLTLVYRISGARGHHTKEAFLSTLKGHRFVHHKLEYGNPFPDDSIDYIYSSHFLEHLAPEDADHLLRDAYRTLKRGGMIRIGVPDLEIAFRRYQQGDREGALHLFYCNPGGRLHRHEHMYDFELLRAALEAAGFSDIKRCEFRKGEVPDIEQLDNREDQTVFVEARKL